MWEVRGPPPSSPPLLASSLGGGTDGAGVGPGMDGRRSGWRAWRSSTPGPLATPGRRTPHSRGNAHALGRALGFAPGRSGRRPGRRGPPSVALSARPWRPRGSGSSWCGGSRRRLPVRPPPGPPPRPGPRVGQPRRGGPWTLWPTRRVGSRVSPSGPVRSTPSAQRVRESGLRWRDSSRYLDPLAPRRRDDGDLGWSVEGH